MLQWGKKMIEPSKSNLSESVHNEYPIEARQHCSHFWTPGGGFNKVLYWKGLPWGLTPYPFIHPLWKKRYPFRKYSFDQCYPFHIPSLEHCIPWTAAKALSTIWIYHKIRTYSRLFHSNKMHLLALVVPLPYPFIYLKDDKGTPFGRSPPRILYRPL